MSQTNLGKIITFYSYKGGTGRSMALANVACVLAKDLEDAGGRVLILDWDLEAPGLHRFFPLKCESEENTERPGLINYFNALVSMLDRMPGMYGEINKPGGWEILDRRLSLRDFIISDVVTNVDLIKAGRYDAEYAKLIGSFDWIGFYTRYAGALKAFTDLIASRYVYCLVDSRTGLTDISGICTTLLPEKLVAVFTPNQQSLYGLIDVLERCLEYRRSSDDFRPLSIFPLPSRIDIQELNLKEQWRSEYQTRFEEFFFRAYGLAECHLSDYFDEIQLLYFAYFSYGEKIAVLEEKRADATSLSRQYRVFADQLIGRDVAWKRETVEESTEGVYDMRQNLCRRINQVNLKKLAENRFWRQAQPILSSYLLNSAYKRSLYVEPYVGPDKKLSENLSDFLRRQEDPWILLLVGQYGVGKSSALKHFSEDILEVQNGVSKNYAWVYYDGNQTLLDVHTHDGLIESLSNIVATVTNHYLTQKGIDRASFYDMVFRDDEGFARMRILGADSTTSNRQLVKEALAADTNKHLLVSLRFLVRQFGEGRVAVVFDNLDPQDDDVQFQGVTLASHLSAACRVKTIVAVRRSTDTALRKSHPKAINILVQTHVNAPSMVEVIKKRVDQALLEEDDELQDVALGEGSLVAKLSDSPEFSEVLAKGLSHPRVSAFLDGIANGSVREGLHCAHTIYSSHFLDARKILKKLSPVEKIVPSLWHGHIPYAIVVKALMFNNSQIYEPGREIGNIFGTYRSSSHLGPYLRLLILKYLRKGPEGTLDVLHLKANIERILRAEPADIDDELAWLADQSWIEFLPEDKTQLTVRGKFFADVFRNDREYLTHISIDVDMYEAMESRLKAPADNPQQRLNNLLVLVEYLMDRELQMLLALTKFKHRNLDDYVSSFGSLPITADMLAKIIYDAQQMRAWADADRDDLDAVQALREKLRALQEGKVAQEILRVIKSFTSEG